MKVQATYALTGYVTTLEGTPHGLAMEYRRNAGAGANLTFGLVLEGEPLWVIVGSAKGRTLAQFDARPWVVPQ